MLFSFWPPIKPSEKSCSCCLLCYALVDIIIVAWGGSGGNVDSGLIIGTFSKGKFAIFKLLVKSSILFGCIYYAPLKMY